MVKRMEKKKNQIFIRRPKGRIIIPLSTTPPSQSVKEKALPPTPAIYNALKRTNTRPQRRCT